MTMKISRKEMLKALEPLKPALSGRSSIAELAYIWFDGKSAYAFDGGMGIRVALETPFRLGLLGSVLLGLLSLSGPDEVTIEESDGALTFKAGRSRTKLNSLNFERWVWKYPPDDEPLAALASIKVSKALLEGLRRVLVLKPSSPKRMEHHGVALLPYENEVELYTTDSKRLAFMPVNEKLTGDITSTVLPRGFAEQILSRANPTACGQLEQFDKFMRVHVNAKLSLFSNVFDTSNILDFPGTLRKVVGDKAKPFKLPEGFTDALERAALLAGGDDHDAVMFETKGEKLTLRGRFKLGQLDEEFDLGAKQPTTRVMLYAGQLLSLKDIEEMSLSDRAGVMYGKDELIFAVASKTDEEAAEDAKNAAKEPAEAAA